MDIHRKMENHEMEEIAFDSSEYEIDFRFHISENRIHI